MIPTGDPRKCHVVRSDYLLALDIDYIRLPKYIPDGDDTVYQSVSVPIRHIHRSGRQISRIGIEKNIGSDRKFGNGGRNIGNGGENEARRPWGR